jgi:tRNA (guanine-N7-)-methyltransferase
MVRTAHHAGRRSVAIGDAPPGGHPRADRPDPDGDPPASDASLADDVPPPPGVRTTRRRGRTSAAKLAALRDLGPRWMLPGDGPWDPDPRGGLRLGRPALVDVGVGDGRATRAWADDHPRRACSPSSCTARASPACSPTWRRDGPPNVRVVEADASPCSRARPRFGARHPPALPRPLAQAPPREAPPGGPRVRAPGLPSCWQPGGTLHVATDWDDYAEHVRTAVATEPRLAPVPDAAPAPGPTTTYEARGERAGRTITDLVRRPRGARPMTRRRGEGRVLRLGADYEAEYGA